MTQNNTENNTLFIIDTASIIFRSYYAIKNSKANVLYGFVSTFRKILEQKPKYLISTMDVSRQTFRNDIFPEYKANREETPEDLKQQIPYVLKFLSLLNVPNLSKQGYEADDIIASLVNKFSTEVSELFVVTKDKDLMQLVKDHSFVYDVYKNITYDKKLVFEKYEVYPEQILDYLSIVGDSSDNIPGVRGIGPKGASILLKNFKSIESIYNMLSSKNLDNLDSKQIKIIEKYKKLLLESKENALLSKKLASLVNNLEIDLRLTQSKINLPDSKIITNFLSSFGFRQETARWKELLDRLNKKRTAKQKDLF